MAAQKRASTIGRGEATRRRIIEQSAPIFNQHGYAGTSIAALMAATGLEKGGIYRHFESKQSLAAAAFDFAWDAVSTPRRRGIESCESALKKLSLLVNNFVDRPPRALSGGCPLLNTAVDSDDGDPVLRSKACAALDQWQASLAGIVRDGQRSGELRGDIDPNSVAVILISALEGAVMVSRLNGSREPLRIAGRHLQAYLSALQA